MQALYEAGKQHLMTIEEARTTVKSASAPTEQTRQAIVYLNEHADEHWAFIGGSWHRSVLVKKPITVSPLPGDMAGIGN